MSGLRFGLSACAGCDRGVRGELTRIARPTMLVGKRQQVRNQAMNEIQRLEKELFELTQKLNDLRQKAEPERIQNYPLRDLSGDLSLLDLFGEHQVLFAIHNMGQGCRYCTLWADGLNGFLPHLEDKFAVALLSKDEPAVQRRMANARGWRFRMASHGGGAYIQEQTVMAGEANYPGIVSYRRDGERIFRLNSACFGPGDEFCSIWNILSLAGENPSTWTPQYGYWKRPGALDDGGENIVD